MQPLEIGNIVCEGAGSALSKKAAKFEAAKQAFTEVSGIVIEKVTHACAL